jgi:hypothetical protein
MALNEANKPLNTTQISEIISLHTKGEIYKISATLKDSLEHRLKREGYVEGIDVPTQQGSRHWNVKRHLYAKHNGIGEPICNDTNSSRNKLNVKAFNSSRKYYTYPNDLNPIPKSFHKHHDFAEETLNFLRKMVEYKN